MAPRATTNAHNADIEASLLALSVKKCDKPIVLNKLNPNIYRTWAIQAKSSLVFFECWNIVTGEEQEPPANRPNLRALYRARASQAHNALMSAVDSRDVFQVQGLASAKEIWDRLKTAFGKTDQIKFVESLFKICRLSKEISTSLTDHIRTFEALIDDYNYHCPDNVQMPLGTRNLLFIASLGTDWRDFLRTIRKEIVTMEPQELYSQVESALLNLPTHDGEVTALTTRINGGNTGKRGKLQDRIDGFNNSNSRRNKNGRRFKGNNFRSGGKNRGSRPSRPKSNLPNAPTLEGARRPPPKDPNALCTSCGKVGHITDNCFHRLWVEAQNSKSHSEDSRNTRYTSSSYLPSFNFNVNVTRFSIRSAVHVSHDPYIWVVDSGADAIIHPSKDRLQNYKAFNFPKEVAGIGGVPVSALGSGSITLHDPSGNHFTLLNAVYVPEATCSVLSMMELEEQGLLFDFVRQDLSLETRSKGNFRLTSMNSTDFVLEGHAIGKLLYVAEAPSILPLPNPSYQVNTARQRNKRRRLNTEVQPSRPPKPLKCNPDILWHLRFQHAASSTLKKLPLIASQ